MNEKHVGGTPDARSRPCNTVLFFPFFCSFSRRAGGCNWPMADNAVHHASKSDSRIFAAQRQDTGGGRIRKLSALSFGGTIPRSSRGFAGGHGYHPKRPLGHVLQPDGESPHWKHPS